MDNTLVWADIPTRDLDRAMDFYSALLDVQVTPIQEETMRFAMLRHDGSNAAACLGPMDKYHQPGGAGPLIYLSLGDRLQEAELLVPRLGGRVLEPLHSIGSGHGSRVQGHHRGYRRQLAGPLCPTSKLTSGYAQTTTAT